jgi:hypothetical protein
LVFYRGNALMSQPDKRTTGLMVPKHGLAWPEVPLALAGPALPDTAALLPSAAPVSLDLSGLAATDGPAIVGQFGPGAMQRRRDPRVVYAVPCHSDFRSAALTLAKARGVAVAELVRMVLALVAPGIRAVVPDPGEPGGSDPDPSAGLHHRGDHPPRPTLVPTLVLRLAPGLDHATIRQALAVALALDDPTSHRLVREDEHRRLSGSLERLEHRNRALARAVERLAFRPRAGTLGPGEAASVLGFMGERDCDEQQVARRFRELAPIFHPDTGVLPCRERMGQLIEARNVLIRHLRRPR